MTLSKKRSTRHKILTYLLLIISLLYFRDALADDLGTLALKVLSNLPDIARLLTAGAYTAGFGFMVGAVLKFKAHKENSSQVTLSQPITLVFVAAALIYLPSVFSSAGGTLFGSKGEQATINGVASFNSD
jgi:intracellular multiplication protein IcmD